MNSSGEPATESQLSRLGQFGYFADCPLTKGEAAYLITVLEQQSEIHASVEHAGTQIARHTEYALRLSVEHTRRALAEAEANQIERLEHSLALLLARRCGFWTDTCRDPTQMQHRSPSVLDLYMKYGCLFVTPTPEQTQEILDALDRASPVWDRDHFELFFETLVLNFPELLRKV